MVRREAIAARVQHLILLTLMRMRNGDARCAFEVRALRVLFMRLFAKRKAMRASSAHAAQRHARAVLRQRV